MSIYGMVSPNIGSYNSENFQILKSLINKTINNEGVLNYLSLFENGVVSFCDNSAKNELIPVRSISKLVTSLCYGIAADRETILNESTFIWPIIESIARDVDENSVMFFKNMRIEHLLTQTVRFKNERFLYSDKIADVNQSLGVLLKEPIIGPNGETFCYSNGTAYLLSIVLQRVLGENLSTFANKYLFEPLGISCFQWEDRSGYCAGATGLLLQAQDVQKLGNLLMNHGKWNDIQIVPEEYVSKMTAPQCFIDSNRYMHEPFHPTAYGYFMWIDSEGNYYISGKSSQFIYFQPKKNRMITILSQQTNTMSIQRTLKHFMTTY